ncbi:DUF4837 family protein [candidate division WOR-3 bacterium]|nr:DUF4837 family protein [candidate division WOR-3 bacterium]
MADGTQKRTGKFLLTICMVTVFSVLLYLCGCSRIPSHVGRSYEIVVLSTIIDTHLIQQNLQVYNFVPQKEGLFKFLFVQDTMVEYYDNYHTLFLYGSLDDDFLKTLLRDDAKTTTRNDTFALFKLDNLWARGQLAIILVASENSYIEQGLQKFKPLIIELLEENYYQRIKATYYMNKMSKQVQKTLKSYGFSLDVDKQWLIDSTYEHEGFIFVHAHFPDRSIFLYKEPSREILSDSLVLKKRNELTARFYHGDYIMPDFTTIDKIEFKEMKGMRIKGVWQNDSLVAGGPFLSYFFVHDDTLYAIDGLLFNPGERKSDFFTTLEVILNSFEIMRSKELQP